MPSVNIKKDSKIWRIMAKLNEQQFRAVVRKLIKEEYFKIRKVSQTKEGKKKLQKENAASVNLTSGVLRKLIREELSKAKKTPAWRRKKAQ